VAAQRGHSTPEAPHTPAAGHRGMHGATSTKTKSRACPTWTPAPSTEYARTLCHLQAPDARWRAEKPRAQSHAPGTQGAGGSAVGHRAFGAAPPSPRPRGLGCGRAAGTPLRERFAHGEGSGHT
jgi:hypothetical protein